MPFPILFELIGICGCWYYYMRSLNNITLQSAAWSHEVFLNEKQYHYTNRNAFIILNLDSSFTQETHAQQIKEYAKLMFDINVELFHDNFTAAHEASVTKLVVPEIRKDPYAYMFGYTLSDTKGRFLNEYLKLPF